MKDIDSGSLIEFSYVDTTPSNPTFLRRKKLLSEKGFFCTCPKCVDFDYSRAQHCHRQDCSGYITCIQVKQEDQEKWSCSSCGIVDETVVKEINRRESKVENMLDSYQQNYFNFTKPQDEILRCMKASIKNLSTIHYLTLKCITKAIKLFIVDAQVVQRFGSFGMGIQNTSFSSYKTLRLKAGIFGITFIRACECIDAKCNIPGDCYKNRVCHPPVFTCTSEILFAYRDFKELPKSVWPKGSAQLIRKYLPLCYAKWGKNDAEIKQMEAATKPTITQISKSMKDKVNITER